MATRKGSDNHFPLVRLVPGAAPGVPPTGQMFLYAASDLTLNVRDETGHTEPLGASASYTDPLTTRGDMVRRNASATGRMAIGAAGYLLGSDGTDPGWVAQYVAIPGFIDGGTATPATATTHVWLRVPFGGVIESVTTVADASGSAVVDIKKRAYGGGAASSICASAKPTLSGAQESTDTTLTGWTTTITAGDLLYWVLDSVTTCKKILCTLKVRRT